MADIERIAPLAEGALPHNLAELQRQVWVACTMLTINGADVVRVTSLTMSIGVNIIDSRAPSSEVLLAELSPIPAKATLTC